MTAQHSRMNDSERWSTTVYRCPEHGHVSSLKVHPENSRIFLCYRCDSVVVPVVVAPVDQQEHTIFDQTGNLVCSFDDHGEAMAQLIKFGKQDSESIGNLSLISFDKGGRPVGDAHVLAASDLGGLLFARAEIEAAFQELLIGARRWLSETGSGMHVNTAQGRGLTRRAVEKLERLEEMLDA